MARVTSFSRGGSLIVDASGVVAFRLVSWPKDDLKKFLASNQALRAAMQLVIGTDLVAKLRAA